MRGEGRVFKRGSTWWISYYGPGEDGAIEIRESSKSDSESTARKMLRDRQREVANHRSGVRSFAGPRAERLTVADLLDSLEADYRQREIKSLKKSLGHAKPVREFLGHVRAVTVTPDLVREYIESRRSEGRSSAKVNRETEILSAAFNLALREDRLARKPYIPHLTENNARSGFFEADEHARMLEQLSSPVDEIARFAYVSGWRIGEIRPLTWENVDHSAREIRIHDSKNGEGRVLPLDDETWTLFERRWAARQYDGSRGPALSEYVFHRKGRLISETEMKRAWMTARTKAGLPGKLFHDYRRTAVRNMIRAGVPQAVAMKITGHKTDSMFRRYNIVTTDDKREALKKQAAFLNSQPSSNVSAFRKAADEDTDRTRTIDK
jgi:integrase